MFSTVFEENVYPACRILSDDPWASWKDGENMTLNPPRANPTSSFRKRKRDQGCGSVDGKGTSRRGWQEHPTLSCFPARGRTQGGLEALPPDAWGRWGCGPPLGAWFGHLRSQFCPRIEREKAEGPSGATRCHWNQLCSWLTLLAQVRQGRGGGGLREETSHLILTQTQRKENLITRGLTALSCLGKDKVQWCGSRHPDMHMCDPHRLSERHIGTCQHCRAPGPHLSGTSPYPCLCSPSPFSQFSLSLCPSPQHPSFSSSLPNYVEGSSPLL